MGVIGDVHCESETLERVLDALGTMNVDAVLCVGDLVDGPGDVDLTLGMLEARGVQCVAGNHERWFLTGEQRNLEDATVAVNNASRAFLKTLPRMRRCSTKLSFWAEPFLTGKAAFLRFSPWVGSLI